MIGLRYWGSVKERRVETISGVGFQCFNPEIEFWKFWPMSFIPLCWNIFVELLNLFGVGGLILSHYWIRVANVWKWNLVMSCMCVMILGSWGVRWVQGARVEGSSVSEWHLIGTHLSDAWISTHDYNQDACLYFEHSESTQVLWNVAESGFWTFLWRERLISRMSSNHENLKSGIFKR